MDCAAILACAKIAGMPEFHFVEDYVRHVDNLLVQHPRDEAMALAVGGDYEATGKRLCERTVSFGIEDGDRLIDLGCGSGRVATALSQMVDMSIWASTSFPHSSSTPPTSARRTTVRQSPRIEYPS